MVALFGSRWSRYLALRAADGHRRSGVRLALPRGQPLARAGAAPKNSTKVSRYCDRRQEKWLSFLNAVTWFVARRDTGDGVGVAGLHQSGENEPEVIGMWVVPAERGHGIGAQLTLAAVRQAEHQGARSVKLWVTDGNDTARRMYQRLGFHFTGESAQLPHDSATGERKMSMSLGQD
jgi:RimJ/RimL family protein N-acetyltransferase